MLDEHHVAAPLPLNRRARNDNGLSLFAEDYFSGAEDIRPKATIAIFQIATDFDRASFTVCFGADPGDVAAGLPASIRPKVNLLTKSDPFRILQPQVEIQPHRSSIGHHEEDFGSIHNFTGHNITGHD